MKKRIVALLLAVIMLFAFSGCVVDIDFLLNGWDGIYTEKERAQYVYPNPAVRTHEIREDHKVTTVNHKVDKTSNAGATTTTSAASSAATSVAATDAP